MTWFKPDELSCQPMLDRSLVDKYRCIEYTEYRTFRDYYYPVLTIKMKTTKSKLPKRKISRTSVSSALVPTASADLEYLHNHSFSHEIPPMAEEVLTDDESEDDELPVLPRPSIPDSELSPQYWLLLKVVKYIKVSFNKKMEFVHILNFYSIKVRKPNGNSFGSVRSISL